MTELPGYFPTGQLGGDIKSILNGKSQNPGTVTIKKLCDAFEITLGELFFISAFDQLEQEIR